MMLDQDLLSKNGLGDVQQPPPHLAASYSQFQQYQQTMAGYNNMGYGFPAAMYTQNGYGYSLAGYPHAPSPSSDGKALTLNYERVEIFEVAIPVPIC